MDISTLQLNPVSPHVGVVIPQPQPSGVSLFSATATAEETGFCVLTLGNANDIMTDEQIQLLLWRTSIQVLVMQMDEYQNPRNTEDDKTLWKTAMWESLCKINQKAQQMQTAPCMPADLWQRAGACHVLSVRWENWSTLLMKELAEIFLNVASVNTLKIEITND